MWSYPTQKNHPSFIWPLFAQNSCCNQICSKHWHRFGWLDTSYHSQDKTTGLHYIRWSQALFRRDCWLPVENVLASKQLKSRLGLNLQEICVPWMLYHRNCYSAFASSRNVQYVVVFGSIIKYCILVSSCFRNEFSLGSQSLTAFWYIRMCVILVVLQLVICCSMTHSMRIYIVPLKKYLLRGALDSDHAE